MCYAQLHINFAMLSIASSTFAIFTPLLQMCYPRETPNIVLPNVHWVVPHRLADYIVSIIVTMRRKFIYEKVFLYIDWCFWIYYNHISLFIAVQGLRILLVISVILLCLPRMIVCHRYRYTIHIN